MNGGPDVDILERKNGNDELNADLLKEKNNNNINNMPATTIVYGPMPYS